ncbi:MAG: type II secretion system minor pseudopilin GspI [Gammaproteobacteria bacterium]
MKIINLDGCYCILPHPNSLPQQVGGEGAKLFEKNDTPSRGEGWGEGVYNTKTVGFTLIEILLALLICSIALITITKTISLTTRNFSHIENKTYATIIANNVMSEIQLGLTDVPSENNYLEAFQQTWSWKAKLFNTNNQHLQKIIVYVKQSGNSNILFQLTSYRYA